jgi:hypothetical protein
MGHADDRAALTGNFDMRLADKTADNFLIEYVSKAWEKHQQGDDSGYPFVFTTAEGAVVITQRQIEQDQVPNANAV